MIKGKRMKRVEKNPRRTILVQIGTGNKYCTNCNFAIANDYQGFICFAFMNPDGIGRVALGRDSRGYLRCSQCLEAERAIEDIRASAFKQAEDAIAFRNANPLDRRKAV